MFAGINSQFSSKPLIFMSKIWIVARRLGCQLATTAPVLTPPGKPSTWFPGEELVTQGWFCAIFCILLVNHEVSSRLFVCHVLSCV